MVSISKLLSSLEEKDIESQRNQGENIDTRSRQQPIPIVSDLDETHISQSPFIREENSWGSLVSQAPLNELNDVEDDEEQIDSRSRPNDNKD